MRTALTDSAREEDLRRLLHAHDLKKFTLISTLGLAWKSIGVIYGDVGTSPLYTIATVFSGNVEVNESNILGVTSLMVWSLTVILVIKYAAIVLRANDNGEGGTFALYSLLCRELGISPNQSVAGGGEVKTIKIRKLKAQSQRLRASGYIVNAYSASPVRRWIRQSIPFQFALMAICIMGVGLIIGDGVLTPAISVMSAISGITGVTQGDIVGISILILFLLFAAQSFGTSKIGFTFAPIVLIWLLSIAIIGIYNLCEHGWGIWAGLNPAQIVYYFQNTGFDGWISLGGVILTVTGTEALFADLGHFSQPAIQLSCMAFVYPCLLFTYLGQLSYLTANPSAASNIFWACIPSQNGALYWYMVVISTLATIVASQAMITGVFSIVRQAISLGLLPPLHIIHTGMKVEGQIYVPLVNWTLCLLCICVVAGFQNTIALGNAYGLAVSAVMFLTTLLMTLHMIVGWELHWALITVFFLFYIFVEGAFLSANAFKIPNGGWFTLAVGGAVMALMWVWWLGSNRLKRMIMSTSMKPKDFFRVVSLSETMMEETPHLLLEEQSRPPQRVSMNLTEVASGVGRSSVGIAEIATRSVGRRSFNQTTSPTLRARTSLGHNPIHNADGTFVLPVSSTVPEDSVPAGMHDLRPFETSQPAAIETTSNNRILGTNSIVLMNPNIACLSSAAAPERPLVVMPGLGVYYSDSQEGIPPVMARFLQNIHAVHRVTICLSVWTLPIPVIEPQFRMKVTRARKIANFYQVLVRYGYKERVDHGPMFIAQLVSAIKDLLQGPEAEEETESDEHNSNDSKHLPGNGVVVEMANMTNENLPREPRVPRNWPQVPDSVLSAYMQDLQVAVEEGVVYYVGRIMVRGREDEPWTWSWASVHRLYEPLFALMLSSSWADNRGFVIPQKHLVELGMTVNLE